MTTTLKWNKTEKIGGPESEGCATSKCGRFRVTKQYFGAVGSKYHWHTEVRVDLNAEGEDEQGQGWTGNYRDDDGNLFRWDDRGDFRTLTEAKAAAQKILAAIATDQLTTAVGENARLMEAIGRDN